MITRTTEYQLHTAKPSPFCEFLRLIAFLTIRSAFTGREYDKWELFEMGYRNEEQIRQSGRFRVVEGENRKSYLKPKRK